VKTPVAEAIKAEIEARHWSELDLIYAGPFHGMTLSRLLAGLEPMTPDIAERLTRAFPGRNMDFWMTLGKR